jgi:hypothetical protein
MQAGAQGCVHGEQGCMHNPAPYAGCRPHMGWGRGQSAGSLGSIWIVLDQYLVGAWNSVSSSFYFRLHAVTVWWAVGSSRVFTT